VKAGEVDEGVAGDAKGKPPVVCAVVLISGAFWPKGKAPVEAAVVSDAF
jgi:hypothetical protein